MSDVVFTRDLSSGTVHKRVRDGDRLLVDERCNLDSAGKYEVVTSLDTNEDLCGYCFPVVDVSPEDEA